MVSQIFPRPTGLDLYFPLSQASDRTWPCRLLVVLVLGRPYNTYRDLALLLDEVGSGRAETAKTGADQATPSRIMNYFNKA